MKWTYAETDPAVMLFTAAQARWNLQWPPDGRVLELGCAETRFAEHLSMQNPECRVVGVDYRRDRAATGWDFIEGSALDRSLFAEAAFDAVVMLGAVEHFGMGFYGDPVDDDGDTRTMHNVACWLKPGGWVYFDVPCNPEYSVAENRHFRTYSPASVRARLIVDGLVERCRAYSLPEPAAGTWCDEPTEHRVPYHFVAVVADKPAFGGVREPRTGTRG